MKILLQYIKYFLNRLLSPKYKRLGKCKQCGQCCRQITLKIDNDFITSEELFLKLKSWQPHYNHFFISGKLENGVLLFTCKSLGDDNLCKDYWKRSLFCRHYPVLKSDFIRAGGETLENCGFYYKPAAEFSSFINK